LKELDREEMVMGWCHRSHEKFYPVLREFIGQEQMEKEKKD